MIRAKRVMISNPSGWLSEMFSRIISPSRTIASAGVSTLASNAHRYGEKSHDHPRTSPLATVWMIRDPDPG